METTKPFYTHPRYAWAAAALLVLGAAWVWLSASPPGQTTGGQIPAPQAGFLAPDFTLETASGERITLSALQGRPVILNLWASWCLPCRAEMPDLEEVYQAYQEAGLVVLAVNATNQDSQANALAFAAEHALTFPIVFDIDGAVSRQYNLLALPTTYFIRPDGVIEEVVVGGPMAAALLRTRVERLLEETP